MEEVLEAKPGRHYYAQGLVLIVDPDGWRRKWVFRYISLVTGKPTETTLFSALTYTAEEARHRIGWIRKNYLDKAIDPVQANRQRRASFKTFAEVSSSWIETNQSTWSSSQLYSANLLLFKHAAELGDMMVGSINADKIQSVLRPLWDKHPAQGRRTLAMLEVVFEYAAGMGWLTGANPAKWKGLHQTRWPRVRSQEGKHHASMDYTELPNFIKKTRARQSRATAAVALEFLILTAARADEVLRMTRGEYNLDQKLWVLQAHRTKQRSRHRVALSNRAVELLREQEEQWSGSNYVFTGRSHEALAEKSMLLFLRSIDTTATVHGFRATFKTWALEQTEYQWELIELCLGHSIGTDVARAYLRGDALEKRREIMSAWSKFIG